MDKISTTFLSIYILFEGRVLECWCFQTHVCNYRSYQIIRAKDKPVCGELASEKSQKTRVKEVHKISKVWYVHTMEDRMAVNLLWIVILTWKDMLSELVSVRDHQTTHIRRYILSICVSKCMLCILCVAVVQLHVTLHDAVDCSTSGFPVLHYLPESDQTHIHWVSDAIQPSHPLSPTSPPALNLSQHQDLFHWVCPSRQVTRVLELQLQHQSLQWIFRTDLLQDGLIWSLCCPRVSPRVFSNTTVRKPQFFSSQSSLWSNSHIHTCPLEKTIALTVWTFVVKVMSLIFNMLSRLEKSLK